MAEEKTVNVTFRELADGVERPVGAVHELVVQRSLVKVYDLEGLFFFPDGAVFMPQVPNTPVASAAPQPSAAGAAKAASTAPNQLPPEQLGDGLLLVRNLLSNAQAASGRKCLVTAHTDRVSGARALELTRRRADNVLWYLKGDRAAFAASCLPCEDTEWKAILQWVAERFGYPCDPGPISTPLRAQARAAMRRFRRAFNEDRGGKLDQDGEVNAADFGAFFELYDAWTARMLGDDKLAAQRAKLSFLDPGSLGVGAAFLNQGARADGRRAPDNRRAELLMFDTGHLPNLELLPLGRHVHDGREFTLQPLEVEPAQYVVLELALSEDVVNALPDDATLTLSGPPGPAQKRVLANGVRDAGRVSYGFDWINPSVTVTLKAKAGAREVVIFEDQTRGDASAALDVTGALEELLDDEQLGDDSESLFAGDMPDFDGDVELRPAGEGVLALPPRSP